MKLTPKQRKELRRHDLQEVMPKWKRPENSRVAAALERMGLLHGADFSERGLHDSRRLYWREYQLTEAGLNALFPEQT